MPLNDRAALEAAIGHVFQDPSLLKLALTHRSVHGSQNNERLEFLGDSLLGYVVAEALFHRFPRASEGELTRGRARLVNEKALSELATRFNLGDFLRLGPGELKSGGWRRASILADALEALTGAICLDAGMEVTKTCVLNWYAPLLDALRIEEVSKDAKTRLQEYLQGRGLPLPVYDVVETSGRAHEQRFHVSCSLDKETPVTTAWADTRRLAEQGAAEAMLAYIEQEKKS